MLRCATLFVISLCTLCAAAVSAPMQDPGAQEGSTEGAPPEGVKLPSAPTEASGGFEFVQGGGTSAKAKAESFVEGKGWSTGWDVDKGWGVWIGTSTLTAADATGLALAMIDAQLDAKFQFAEYLAGVTETLTLKNMDKNPGARQAEMERLEKLASAPGGDPVAADVRALLGSAPTDAGSQNVALRNSISRASRTLAQAAIPGMVPIQTFVETKPGGLEGTVSVVLVSTPKSRQIADAMLGKGSTPKGTPGMSIKDFAQSLPPEALVYSCGSTYRFNEKGELCMLGFGTGSVDAEEGEEGEDDEEKFAETEARQDATDHLRAVAGELVEGSRLLSRVADKTKLLDGSTKSESARSVSVRIATIAKGLKLPGVTDVLKRRVRHPVLGDVVCIVRQWNLSDAKNAATLREQFAKQGGWKGGEGVQPGGSGSSTSGSKASKPKGVPSGQGGPGLDDE